LKEDDEKEQKIGNDKADEFVRNFFIKYGMKKTIEAFQREWFKLKTENKIDYATIPDVPAIYLENQKLHDQLAFLQKELDTAKIIADKAETTGKKLCKQRDLRKIHHRRIQQEKDKLNAEIEKLKGTYEKYQGKFKELSGKYESLRTEKMLLDFQRKGIQARCEQLEKTKKRLEEALKAQKEKDGLEEKLNAEAPKPKKDGQLSPKKESTAIPDEIPNPALEKRFDPMNIGLTVLKSRKGHMLGVSAIALSPKKDIFATSSDDTTWKLWTIPQGDLIMCGEGHQDWVSSISFHPKGMMLATGSGDCSIKIWDLVTASYKITLLEHAEAVWALDYHFSGDFLVSGSMDQSAKLWDINTQKCKFSYRGHVDSVNTVKWKPYTNYFMTGSADKSISLWDIRSNLCVQTFNGHNNAVNSIAFTMNGDQLASGDADGIVKIWDIKMVREMGSYDCGKHAANSVTWDNSGQFVVVGGDDGKIRLYFYRKNNNKNSVNAVDKKVEEGNLGDHEDSVQAMAFTSDGKYLITGSLDCTFKIWS